ncbi:hypothetical protein JKJ07_28390 [Actinoplanes sp. LDG1-01]|uniref:DUF624 domain-containing protein n=1 Tax=Paractinoplanes lichenicola TaxID=2802976 RepID=A0ABS1VUS3_9ACTN|nr:hypothetical protein [Actinoplanes lichenicola]MBL7258233.1 hypothetical protein [Actinoplanes lichenicola]
MPHDWRDSLRLVADLALLGIVMTLACLPVVTAGAAVGTGSAALDKLLTIGRWPTAAELWRSFRTRLVPWMWAGPLVLAAAWLLAIDVAALRRGAVPGGRPLVVVLLVVAALAAGFVALVAGLSAHPDPLRRARALVAARPAVLLAATGVVLLAALLAAFVHPALVPVLAGCTLFAVHAVLRRLAPRGGVEGAEQGERLGAGAAGLGLVDDQHLTRGRAYVERL